MWWLSAPSNPIAWTPQHNHSLGEDSLSDPPELLLEETLEFQKEYPWEEAEEVEEVTQEDLPQCLKEWEGKETNSSETHHPSSQEIRQNQKHS